MNCEIVYVCNSKNNKNVRANELEILRKVEGRNYFEFGESENNIKKRFYDDMKVLEKDFSEITAIKEKLKKDEEPKKEVEAEPKKEVVESPKKQEENFYKIRNKSNHRKNIF